jgi:hypothetical protein
MYTIPEILRGAVALEYAELLTKLQASKESGGKDKPRKEGDSCGSGCTVPGRDPKNDTCPVLPPKKKSAPTFQPVVPGWSEPPAARA